jgi:hypothetical protein
MPKYFQYLISPEFNKTSVMIGLRINDNIVTGYIKSWMNDYKNIPIIGQFFTSASTKHFWYCIDKYKKENELQYVQPYRYLILPNTEHEQSHTENATSEIDILHTHIKHKSSMEIEILQNFLNSLKSCENEALLPQSETFLTDAVCEDIIKQYTAFKEATNASWVTSNNPIYASYPTLSMDEHLSAIDAPNTTQFLLEMGEKNASLPSPVSIMPKMSLDTMIGGPLLLGLFAFKFFNLRNKAKQDYEAAQPEHRKYKFS